MQPLIAIDLLGRGVAVDHRRDAYTVVIAEESKEQPVLLVLTGSFIRFDDFDKALAVAQDSRRLTGGRIAFDLAGALYLEVLADAALLQRQRGERGVWPGREENQLSINTESPVKAMHPGRCLRHLEWKASRCDLVGDNRRPVNQVC